MKKINDLEKTEKAMLFFLLKTEKKDKKTTKKEFESQLTEWLNNSTISDLEAFCAKKEAEKQELQEACNYLLEIDNESYIRFNKITTNERACVDFIKSNFGEKSTQMREFKDYFLPKYYNERLLFFFNNYIKQLKKQ